MTGKKQRSVYRRKRKGGCFTGSRIAKDGPRPMEAHVSPDIAFGNEEAPYESNATQALASKRKLEMPETYDLTPKSSKRVKRTEKVDEVHVECQEQQESADQTGYRLIHIESLSNAIRDVHKCKKGHLILKEEYAKRFGLMSSLYMECSRCHKKTFLPTSNNICTGRGKSYDVNKRAVHCALQLGIGFAGLETFCSTLNLPCLAETSYHISKRRL